MASAGCGRRKEMKTKMRDKEGKRLEKGREIEEREQR